MFEKIKKLFRKTNEAYAIDSDGNRIEVEILPADWTPEKEREYQYKEMMDAYEAAQKKKVKQYVVKELIPFYFKKLAKIFLLAAVIPTAIMYVAKLLGMNIPYFVSIFLYLIVEPNIKSLFSKKY